MPDSGFTRRDLLFCASCAAAAGIARAQDSPSLDLTPQDAEFPAVEAKYYKKLSDRKVECTLCPQGCKVADRERGTCGVRENRGGTYVTLVHSRVCSAHVDPIEKKPFFHFLPGTQAFSLATPGCNMWCKFCQNWEISQFRPEQVTCHRLSPGNCTAAARRYACPTVCFTYTEPVIFTEYLLDVAKEKGALKAVAVSNGFINEEPLKDWLKVLDAVKVDLKAFTQKFYEEITGGKPKDVLDSLVRIKASGKWLEIVTLLIPTLNDSEKEARDLAGWVMKNLGPDVPLHFTRFHPQYRLKNLPATPISTLERARNAALAAGLHYVYLGNVPGHSAENTLCPKCGKEILKRYSMSLLENHVLNGVCEYCKTKIPGVWA
jgi:pyruvate formate lyase activating enzyme